MTRDQIAKAENEMTKFADKWVTDNTLTLTQAATLFGKFAYMYGQMACYEEAKVEEQTFKAVNADFNNL